MVEVKVELTPRNVSRLRNGHTVQLKHGQIGSGTHTLNINDTLAKKIHAASKKNKGVKIQLSAQEIEASGLKLRDVGRALKTVGRVYRENVRPVVAPVIRKVLTEGIKKGLPAAAIALGQPQLTLPAAAIANEIAAPTVDALGKATGGFGIKKKRTRKPKPASLSLFNPVYGGGESEDAEGFSMTGFLPLNHPAMKPDNDVLPDHAIRGGSFKLAK